MSDWRNLQKAACRETDKTALAKLASEAEAAMYLRLQELAYDRNGSPEIEELRAAIREFIAIRTTKLGWPDPTALEYDIFSGDPKERPTFCSTHGQAKSSHASPRAQTKPRRRSNALRSHERCFISYTRRHL